MAGNCRMVSTRWACTPLGPHFPRFQRARVGGSVGGSTSIKGSERLLAEPPRISIVYQLLCQSVALGEGNESEEFYHLAHVIDPGSAVPLLPGDQGHLIAADDFGNLDLAKPQVQPALAKIIAQGLWARRVALFLCSVRSPCATNPTKCCLTKRQRTPVRAAIMAIRGGSAAAAAPPCKSIASV